MGLPWPFTDVEPVEVDAARRRVTVVVAVSAFDEASQAMVQRVASVADSAAGDAELVVVHSPRHRYARPPALVAEWFDRLAMRCAVPIRALHDPDLETWARLEPVGWPTALVVDGRGRVRGAGLGLGAIPAVCATIIDAVGDLHDPAEPGHAATMADTVSQRVGRRSDRPTTSSLPTVPTAGTSGGASFARLHRPTGVALSDPTDPAGARSAARIAIADNGNDRLLLGHVDLVAGTARLERTVEVDDPRRVAFAEGRVAVTSPCGGSVVVVDAADERAATTSIEGLSWPIGLTVDADGSWVVADAGADRLVRIETDGTTGTIAGSGHTGLRDGSAGAAELCQPVAVTRTPHGLVFCDAGTGSIRFLDDRGRVGTLTAVPPSEPGLVDGPVHRALFQHPADVIGDGDGLWVADRGNRCLRMIAERRVTTLTVPGLSSCEAVAPTGDGRLLVVDTAAHRIVVVDPADGRARALTVSVDPGVPRRATTSRV